MKYPLFDGYIYSPMTKNCNKCRAISDHLDKFTKYQTKLLKDLDIKKWRMRIVKYGDKKVIEIDGLGFILYSDESVKHIKEGENYLENHFWKGEDVASSTSKGEIVGVCTTSSGRYIVEFREGEPAEPLYRSYDYKLLVPLKVSGGKIIIRDLYDLYEWTKKHPYDQELEVEDGLYSIVILSNLPESKKRGDNQEIVFYVIKDADAFLQPWSNIPTLVNKDDLEWLTK